MRLVIEGNDGLEVLGLGSVSAESRGLWEDEKLW